MNNKNVSNEQVDNLVSMIDGYVEEGGHHLNVNVFTRETLLDAQAHPEKYPQLTFASKRIEHVGGDRYSVTGDLTIKDVTREVTFDVTDEGHGKDPWGNMRWGVSGDATINRKDFGLTWNVALETGGWLVADQIKMHAELQLVQVPDPVQEPELATAA